MFGSAHPRRAVADDDDTHRRDGRLRNDAFLGIEPSFGERGFVVDIDRDRTRDVRRTCQPAALTQPQALECRALFTRDRREVCRPGENEHGIRAAHPHAAARFDA